MYMYLYLSLAEMVPQEVGIIGVTSVSFYEEMNCYF